jgi:hypothetical protein
VIAMTNSKSYPKGKERQRVQTVLTLWTEGKQNVSGQNRMTGGHRRLLWRASVSFNKRFRGEKVLRD